MYDPHHPNTLADPAAAAGGGDYTTRGYAAKYSGHKNTHPTRNAVWMGDRAQYVVSGSDDGALFVWDAASAEVINIVKGGSKAVRKVQVRVSSCAACTATLHCTSSCSRRRNRSIH
jgi:WD40 repeat protein